MKRPLKINKENVVPQILHTITPNFMRFGLPSSYFLQRAFFPSTSFFSLLLTAQCRSTTVTLFPQPPSGRCERRRSEGRERIKSRQRTQNGKLLVLVHLLVRQGGVSCSWLCRGNEKVIICSTSVLGD